jgi:hypothetical protein
MTLPQTGPDQWTVSEANWTRFHDAVVKGKVLFAWFSGSDSLLWPAGSVATRVLMKGAKEWYKVCYFDCDRRCEGIVMHMHLMSDRWFSFPVCVCFFFLFF